MVEFKVEDVVKILRKKLDIYKEEIKIFLSEVVYFRNNKVS